MEHIYRIGVDENGLGARLGPLVVTAVLARVDESGRALLKRKLPKRLRADLDDSKRLVAHGDVRLGEAWARALDASRAAHPDALLDALLLEDRETLHAPCPEHTHAQCWSTRDERFEAEDEIVARVSNHLATLAARGVTLTAVKSSVVCTKRINQARDRGKNRFVVDLHAMENLVLALRKSAGTNVVATCGKVGGMGSYDKFFGPLAGHLHSNLVEGAARSSYHFPSIGEVHFVRDADASDPLVMLASLVGKYVRELLMARIARFYGRGGEHGPSGYHDPVSAAFVAETALVRTRRRIPDACFERAGAAAE